MNVIEELERRATNIEERAQARIREASDRANQYPRGKRLTATASANQIHVAERALSRAQGLREVVSLLRSGIVDVYVVRLARNGYNHLGSNVNGVHWAEESAKREVGLYNPDDWEANIETYQVEER